MKFLKYNVFLFLSSYDWVNILQTKNKVTLFNAQYLSKPIGRFKHAQFRQHLRTRTRPQGPPTSVQRHLMSNNCHSCQ